MRYHSVTQNFVSSILCIYLRTATPFFSRVITIIKTFWVFRILNYYHFPELMLALTLDKWQLRNWLFWIESKRDLQLIETSVSPLISIPENQAF